MTSLTPLLWIAPGIAPQVAFYLGVVFWKHWRGYWARRHQAADYAIATRDAVSEEPVEPSPSTWRGLRSFRVERKVLEDTNLTKKAFAITKTASSATVVPMSMTSAAKMVEARITTMIECDYPGRLFVR